MSDEVIYKYVRGKGWVVDRSAEPSLPTKLTQIMEQAMGRQSRFVGPVDGLQPPGDPIPPDT